jgi:hypothetical protein
MCDGSGKALFLEQSVHVFLGSVGGELDGLMKRCGAGRREKRVVEYLRESEKERESKRE